MYQDILSFWFDEIDPKSWWASDADFDDLLKKRFLPVLKQGARGELYAWRESPRGRLAEVMVLDQFSRNIFRNTPAAFAQDGMALVLAQEAVAAGALTVLQPTENAFLLLPYMHSESARIHAVAETLYQQYAPPGNLDFERRHKAIIDRFGRYPHRNDILGRVSTDEEIAFLREPGSRF